MLAALTLPESVEHLVLAGGDGKLGIALSYLRLAPAQLVGVTPALCLDALEKRLSCQQLVRSQRARLGCVRPLFHMRALELGLGGTQVGLRV